jgi:hypothetical protein
VTTDAALWLLAGIALVLFILMASEIGHLRRRVQDLERGPQP